MIKASGRNFNQSDARSQFLAALTRRGLQLPALQELNADGNFHRLDVAHKGTHGFGDGSYCLRMHPYPCGVFNNWTDRNGTEKWRYQPTGWKELTSDELAEIRRAIEAAQSAHDKELAKLQAEAAIKAKRMWSDADEASSDHPYCARKKVTPDGLKMWEFQDGANPLLVPLRNAKGKIVNLQFIHTDGRKHCLRDARQSDCHFWIASPSQVEESVNTIVVCEGWATGETIFQATEYAVKIPDDKCRPEDEFWPAFKAAAPGILGALLDAVAHGLRELPRVKLTSYPRMADFAKWMTACEGALFKPGEFIAAYTDNRATTAGDVVDADIVATTVEQFMKGRKLWDGRVVQLLEALTSTLDEDRRKSREWPKQTNRLTGKLRRAADSLRNIGIAIEIYRHSVNGRSMVEMKKIKRSGFDPSTPSDPSNANVSKPLKDHNFEGSKGHQGSNPEHHIFTRYYADVRLARARKAAASLERSRRKRKRHADDN
jgi:hypothetical protein